MKKLLILLTLISFITPSLYAEEENANKIQVIREAQEKQRNTVAIEGSLIGNIFEVTLMVRMRRTKPRVHNAIVVGSGIGRLSFDSKEVLLATTEEEKPFPTKKKDKALISFSKNEKEKNSTGRVIKQLLKFNIPVDKIREDKKYRLWVQILSSQKGSRYTTYKFDLEDFADLVKQSSLP